MCLFAFNFAFNFAESVAFLDENQQPDRKLAAVVYSNRANALLRIGLKHAAGALADSNRAISLEPGYAKARHWQCKALQAIKIESSDSPAPVCASNLKGLLAQQAPLLKGARSVHLHALMQRYTFEACTSMSRINRCAVQHRENAGRFLVSRQALTAGTVILIEKPFVSLPFEGGP